MKYARISLIVAVDDEAESCLAEVSDCLIQDAGIVLLEKHDEEMNLLDSAAIADIIDQHNRHMGIA